MDGQTDGLRIFSFFPTISLCIDSQQFSPTQHHSLMSPRHLDLGSKSCLLGKPLSFSHRFPARCPSLSPSPTAKAFLVALGLKFTTFLSFPRESRLLSLAQFTFPASLQEQPTFRLAGTCRRKSAAYSTKPAPPGTWMQGGKIGDSWKVVTAEGKEMFPASRIREDFTEAYIWILKDA